MTPEWCNDYWDLEDADYDDDETKKPLFFIFIFFCPSGDVEVQG